jgi:stage II sporulation protein AB (anti-sigma F factor)
MSKSSNVGLARLAVATFASELDFTLNELEEIKVAVSEAVTNSIIHGYPDKIGKIDIKMTIENKNLVVKITDYGVGIEDIDAVLQPSYSTKQEHMGLGLAFIDSFVDQFELESSCGQGTDVTMNKKPVSLQKVAE